MYRLALALLGVNVALGLAPLYTQKETIERMQNGVQLRSHFVMFNEKAVSFGQDRPKLMSWIESELPEVDSHQLNHMYQIGTGFRGFAIWLDTNGLAAVRAHPWVDYVEEDMVVRLPDNENPAIINPEVQVEDMAPFTQRPDWGQVRDAQYGARNLATVPSGQYSGTTYPSGSADTTTWDWTTAVYGGYKLNNTGRAAKVWIVDTGVLFGHQEFGPGTSRVTTVVNYATNNPALGDCNGHGTHCAGSAAGQFRGLASQADIGSVRVLNCQGSGTTADVVAGFNYVANNQKAGATNILSASLGGGASTTTDNAINSAAQAGVIPVVAAGNDNANACNYSPARATGAITVAASNKDDNRASFSNFGTCTFVFSPGQSIHSSYYTNNSAYSTLSGTSMATPLVAGAIAVYASTAGVPTPVRVDAAKTAITNFATRDVVVNPGAGSPNRIINAKWSTSF